MKLTQHLTITGCYCLSTISGDKKLVPMNKIEVNFNFLGYDGTAYIDKLDLNGENPSYDYLETSNEVYDSFEAQLQDPLTWEAIKDYINDNLEEYQED